MNSIIFVETSNDEDPTGYRFFFVLTHFAYAQRPYGDFNFIEIESSHNATSRNVIDTVTPVSFIPANEGGLGCFTGIYNAPDTGYVSGNNQYGDLAKAQFYSLSQMGYGRPATIQSVVVSFGLKQ
jgi:hypothetical protein